jgi:hypothetical protein
MDLQTTGMEFASEMVIKATLVGLHVTEVPTTLDRDGRSRGPHLRPWRDGWRHLRFMLLYCPRWLFLYPGTAMSVAGVTFIGRTLLSLARGDRADTGAYELLVASVAVLLGFQGVAFAFCARIYALLEGLLPRDPELERMFGWLTLETGLVVGSLFLVIGAIGGMYAWAGVPFAGLAPRDSSARLLVAISATTALCMGGQVIFTSFLLSIIGLRRR